MAQKKEKEQNSKTVINRKIEMKIANKLKEKHLLRQFIRHRNNNIMNKKKKKVQDSQTNQDSKEKPKA